MLEHKVPLTVVIITKNEETRLLPALESVSWADEIIVLDDESSDRTCQMAEEFGARVIKRRMDVEGRHRNFGYAQAKNDWVLSLDADERVVPELRDEILELFKPLGSIPVVSDSKIEAYAVISAMGHTYFNFQLPLCPFRVSRLADSVVTFKEKFLFFCINHMLVIRLSRHGRKNLAVYRVVLSEHTKPVKY